jgi:hypothetical protein
MKDLDIKITAKVDYGALASGNQKLKEFLTTLTAVNNAMNGKALSGGGAHPMIAGVSGGGQAAGGKSQGNALTKGVADTAKVLSLAIRSTKDAYSQIERAGSKTITAQVVSLKNLQNQANSTSKAVAGLAGTMANLGRGSGNGGNGRGNGGGGTRIYAAPYISQPPGQGGGPGNNSGYYPNTPGGGGGGNLNYGRLQAFGTGGRVISGAVQQAADFIQNNKTAELQNASGVQDLRRYMLNSSLSGNVAPWFQLNQSRKSKINGTTYNDKLQSGGDTTATTTSNAMSSIASVLDIPLSLVKGGSAMGIPGTGGRGRGGRGGPMTTSDVSNAGGAATGIVNSLGNIANKTYSNMFGGPEAEASRTNVAQLQAMQGADPAAEAMFSTLQQMAGQRVQASKALRGNHFRAAGIGAGYGLDFGESAGHFSSAVGMGGLATAFGTTVGGGTSVRRAMNPFSVLAASQAPRLFGMPGAGVGASDVAAATRDEASLVKQGYKMIGSDHGTDSFSRTTAGQKFRGTGQLSLEMEAMGMDRGASLSTLTRMSDATGGSRGQAAEKAYSRLGELMATGFSKGIDPKLFQELGTEVAEGSITRMGKSTGNEYGRLLMSGLGADSSMTDVKANVDAMHGFNSFSQSNPFQQATRARLANQVMGPNGSGLAMSMIQRSDVSDLVNGSPFLEKLGVSKSQGQSILRSQFNMNGAAYAEKGSDMESALVGAKGDLGLGYKNASEKGKAQIEASFIASGQAQNQPAAHALAEMISAVSSGDENEAGKWKETYKKHTDGDAQATVALTADTISKLASLERENAPQIAAAFKQAMATDLTNKDHQAPAGVEAGQVWRVMLIGPDERSSLVSKANQLFSNAADLVTGKNK